jgi:hypothetical protein
MPNSDLSESIVLAEWAERECRHLDLTASWETLLSVYEMLGFKGPDSDEERLTEYKLIVGELNKFLTRMRKGLASATDMDAAVMFLASHANTADMSAVNTRSAVAYNKLKQRWIGQSISVLTASMPQQDPEERDDDD